jgi:hypothetical protein
MNNYTYETGIWWKDVYGDKETQDYLREETAVSLEESIKLDMEWQRMHYGVCKQLGLNYKALVEIKKDSEAVKHMRLTAYWVGGERGQRIGRERAKRMIAEAYAFSGNSISELAPWLDDGADEDT